MDVESHDATGGETSELGFSWLGRTFSRWPVTPFVLGALGAAIFFLLDLLLPGATAAIGYCGVVAIVGAARRRWPLFTITILCTLLTWIGYAHEPPTAFAGMFEFDRFMVTGVLWLTAILSWQWARGRHALAERAAELAASNASLQHFASVISHDLRSPLSSIGLNAELLAMSLPATDAQQQEALGAIRHGLEDMKAMIQNLLDSSRQRNARLALAPAWCDCGDILRGVINRLQARIDEAGAVVRYGPLPVLWADRVQLSRVFQNLVENAIKYHGPAPPEVVVEAREGPAEWTIAVRDNGIGIAQADAPRVFEMYKRGWSDEKIYAGLGIGLSVCKGIVEGHGGKIWVESESARGATVCFTLPRHAQLSQTAATSQPQPPP